MQKRGFTILDRLYDMSKPMVFRKDYKLISKYCKIVGRYGVDSKKANAFKKKHYIRLDLLDKCKCVDALAYLTEKYVISPVSTVDSAAVS